MRDHRSCAPCEIEMKIEDFLKILSISYFWVSLPQDMLSILCSWIQDCLLSLMNRVDSCVAFATSKILLRSKKGHNKISPKEMEEQVKPKRKNPG